MSSNWCISIHDKNWRALIIENGELYWHLYHFIPPMNMISSDSFNVLSENIHSCLLLHLLFSPNFVYKTPMTWNNYPLQFLDISQQWWDLRESLKCHTTADGCSSFHVATIAKSANRNISTPRQDNNWFSHEIDPMNVLLCLLRSYIFAWCIMSSNWCMFIWDKNWGALIVKNSGCFIDIITTLSIQWNDLFWFIQYLMREYTILSVVTPAVHPHSLFTRHEWSGTNT